MSHRELDVFQRPHPWATAQASPELAAWLASIQTGPSLAAWARFVPADTNEQDAWARCSPEVEPWPASAGAQPARSTSPTQQRPPSPRWRRGPSCVGREPRAPGCATPRDVSFSRLNTFRFEKNKEARCRRWRLDGHLDPRVRRRSHLIPPPGEGKSSRGVRG